MGGRSSSSSASTTNQTDNRRVIGEGGISAENSNVSQSINTTTISSDPTVTKAALGTVRDVADLSISANVDTTNRALQTVDKTTAGAFNFGTDALAGALDYGGKTTAAALNFGTDALSGALDFGKYSVNAITSTAADAMASSDAAASRAAKLANRALDTADSTYGTALQFGKGIVAQAFDAASSSAASVKDAYADAKGRGALTDKILIGAVIAMAVVAVAAQRK